MRGLQAQLPAVVEGQANKKQSLVSRVFAVREQIRVLGLWALEFALVHSSGLEERQWGFDLLAELGRLVRRRMAWSVPLLQSR